jgi:hypothetical protein
MTDASTAFRRLKKPVQSVRFQLLRPDFGHTAPAPRQGGRTDGPAGD